MSDLVERLRDGVARKASGHSALWDSIMSEAADALEALEADNKRLRELLDAAIDWNWCDDEELPPEALRDAIEQALSDRQEG